MAYGRKKSLDRNQKEGKESIITFPHVERRKFRDRFPIEIAFFVGHFGFSFRTVYQKNKTEPVFPFPAGSLPVDGPRNSLPAFLPCLFVNFFFQTSKTLSGFQFSPKSRYIFRNSDHPPLDSYGRAIPFCHPDKNRTKVAIIGFSSHPPYD